MQLLANVGGSPQILEAGVTYLPWAASVASGIFILTDASSLYWSGNNSSLGASSTFGAINRIAVSGSANSILTSEEGNYQTLAADASDLYWSAYTSSGIRPAAAILKIAK